jgi:LCP family protein required for cell wall assembly
MYKRKPLGLRILKGFYIFIVILSGLIVAAFCAYKATVRPPEMEQKAPSTPSINGEEPAESGSAGNMTRRDGVYTFLLFGTDDGNGNTDTIMVGTYDTTAQTLNMVSIPRDTMIETTRSNKRINAVYAAGGVKELEEELSDMLGIPIDFYIQVDLQAFVAIVDAVGGVDFDVPVDMDYEDFVQDLYIHLKKGMQHLDGKTALELVRCRSAYVNQDIGRMQTQQAFLTALAKKMLSIGSVSKVQEFAAIFNQYAETDLKLENIIWLGEHLLSMKMDRLSFQTIPIHDSSYMYEKRAYVTLDMNQVVTMVNEKLNPYTTDLILSDLDMISVQNGKTVHSRVS